MIMTASSNVPKLINLLLEQTLDNSLNWKQDSIETISLTLLNGSFRINNKGGFFTFYIFNKRGEIVHQESVVEDESLYPQIRNLYYSALDNALAITETIGGLVEELEDKNNSPRIVSAEQTATGTKIKFSNNEIRLYMGIPAIIVLDILKSNKKTDFFNSHIRDKYKYMQINQNK